LEQIDDAIKALNCSIDIDPDFLMPYLHLIPCYVNQDQVEAARISAKKVLEIEPSFSLEYYKSTIPMKDQERLDKIISALRKAGLPD